MSKDLTNYTITVCQGIFEGEECFEALVKELPDVAEYGDSYDEAYELAVDSIQTTVEIYDGTVWELGDTSLNIDHT